MPVTTYPKSSLKNSLTKKFRTSLLLWDLRPHTCMKWKPKNGKSFIFTGCDHSPTCRDKTIPVINSF